MKVRNTLLFFAAVLLLAAGLCGCGNAPKEVTYDSLPEHDQAVIDYIFSKRSLWENGCSSAGFQTEDDATTFWVSYVEMTTSDTYSGWTRWYAFDETCNEFSEVDSSFKVYQGFSLSGEKLSPSLLSEWDSLWSDTQKKDYLAQKYDSYLKG